MKQTLLLSFFFLLSLSLSAQTNFWRLSATQPAATSIKVELKIFPNPATDHISLTQQAGVKSIRVFNLVGKQMKAFPAAFAGEKYYIGDLPQGIYLVQMLGKDEKIITTQRLQKQ